MCLFATIQGRMPSLPYEFSKQLKAILPRLPDAITSSLRAYSKDPTIDNAITYYRVSFHFLLVLVSIFCITLKLGFHLCVKQAIAYD